MKNLKKALIAGTCSVLLVAGSVAGTMAWLQDTDEVVNTFTVGNVQIELDEKDVDNSTAGENDRDKANKYHLMPGITHEKDPIVWLEPNSEASYLFVEVTNGLADIESTETGYVNIATQITNNGWTALTGVTNVYYKSVPANTSATERVSYPVFTNFTIKDTVTGTELDDYKNAEIKVVAYAIQSAEIGDETTAWHTVSGK